MSADDEKRQAAEQAARLVRDGMTVGLGTGSTAAMLVRALARRIEQEGLETVAVPTSEATRRQAEALAVPLTTLDDAPDLDLTIDGADEIGPDLALIKGGGGALLREKLTAAASRRLVVIADSSKRVATLGRFPLPIEVVPFGFETTRARVSALLQRRGPIEIDLRRTPDGQPFVTDGGHWIMDVRGLAIEDPAPLAEDLKAVLGVVEHGLFVGMADLALIGTKDGVMELARGGTSSVNETERGGPPPAGVTS